MLKTYMWAQVNVKMKLEKNQVPRYFLLRDQLPPSVCASWLTGYKEVRFLFEKGPHDTGILRVLSAEAVLQRAFCRGRSAEGVLQAVGDGCSGSRHSVGAMI
jgi:hypothetical protein